MGDSSCVETSAVPDWLEKLEKRRELVSKGRLGHEHGAGAPCNVCGMILKSLINMNPLIPPIYRLQMPRTRSPLLEEGVQELQMQERSARLSPG